MAGSRELIVCRDVYEAKIIQGLLETNGIPCVVAGDGSSGMLPFTVDGMAEVRILVDEKNYELAKALIESEPVDDTEQGSDA